MHKITPFLWFDTQAEEAARFYCSVFANSKILQVARYGDAGPGAKGSVMTVVFELDGQRLIALNGGPHFKLTPAFSLSVACETQAEVDALWDKLIADGGEPSQCGWLRDKFGLSWQIVPSIIGEIMSSSDAKRSRAAMEAMMKMGKLDIAALKAAYDGAR